MSAQQAIGYPYSSVRYALQLAEHADLHPTNPIVLSLVLNYAVNNSLLSHMSTEPLSQTYLYDMQNDVMGAIARASTAFDNAIG